MPAYADMPDAMGFGPLAEAPEEDKTSRALLVIAILGLNELVQREGGQQVLAAITAQLANFTAAAKGLPPRDMAGGASRHGQPLASTPFNSLEVDRRYVGVCLERS